MTHLPSHLAGHQAAGLVALEPLAQYQIGDARNFVYLLIYWDSREAFLVDPHEGLDPVFKDLAEHQLTLAGVLLTHTHWDHILGLPEVAARFPGTPVFVHDKDLHRLKKNHSKEKNLEFKSPESLHRPEILFIHTPGHSAGEVCIEFCPPSSDQIYLLTGDTLFIRDCGRTDLETGSNEEMFESLKKLASRNPSSIILPGHHYQPEVASTLSKELKQNKALTVSSVAELMALP